MADFCPRGHPLTADNVLSNGKGHRACRICRLAWHRRRRTERAAGGLCTECGGGREDPARRICDRCRELAASRKRLERAAA